MKKNVVLNYDSSFPLNGAFTYLQNYTGKTDINNGFVKTNSSSTNTGTDKNFPIVKRDIGEYNAGAWCSNDENRSWYEIEFINYYFYLEGYLIRASPVDFFSDWQVLGSNNGRDYDVIDDVSGNTQPASYNNFFECKYPKTRKKFKIITNGKRFKGDNHFCIWRIEFFGRFSSRSKLYDCSRVKICKNHHSLVFLLIITISY